MSYEPVPIKRFARIMSGKAPPEEEPGSSVTFPVFGSNGQIGTTHRYNSSSPTLIVGRVGASGALHLTKGPTWISDNALIVDASPRSVDLRFLHFALSTVDFEPLISTTAQPLLTGSSLSRVMVPRPPLDVQRAIADFLDRKTATLDALIDKKERLLALLQEKRQALITQAVTKGLDPNVPMKDSGIEWLGEIPAHWEVQRGKFLLRPFGGLAPESVAEAELGVDYFKVDDLNHGDSMWIEGAARRVSVRGGVVAPPTILIPKRGAAIFTNKVRLFARPAITDSNTMALRCVDSRVDIRFLARSLWARRLEDVADVSTIPQINNKHVRELWFAVPPAAESQKISDALDDADTHFHHAKSRLDATIDRLREYRQALITAAVTGQLDVTGERA